MMKHNQVLQAQVQAKRDAAEAEHRENRRLAKMMDDAAKLAAVKEKEKEARRLERNRKHRAELETQIAMQKVRGEGLICLVLWVGGLVGGCSFSSLSFCLFCAALQQFALVFILSRSGRALGKKQTQIR